MNRKREIRTAMLFILPAVISVAVFTLAPIAYTVYISFTNYNMYHLDDYDLVGLSNYISVINGSISEVFFPVLGWTLTFATLCTVGCYIIGVALALLLNNPHMREAKIYKSILIIPWALPATIAILSWQGLLNESSGALNTILTMLGGSGVPWMTNTFWARVGIIIVNLWLGFPYMMNVCLGSLQSIDTTYYEAATVDGATKWQSFKAITFPLMTRMSIPIIVSNFAFNFNNFSNIYMITKGGPARVGSQFAGSTDILASTIYKMTTQSNRYELSATLSVISFAIVGTLTLINLNLSGAFKEVN